MKTAKTPDLQQAGTAKYLGREVREKALAAEIAQLEQSDPEGFDFMLKLLEQLTNSSRGRL